MGEQGEAGQAKKGVVPVLKAEETRQILTILKVNYPQSFRGWTPEQGRMFLELWAEAFKDDPAELVVQAVKAIIYGDKREFAPNIGQVKDRMYTMTHSGMLDADRAWEMVKRAVQRGDRGKREEWEKFPEEVKDGVGSFGTLVEWGRMDADSFDRVIMPFFKKGYKERLQKKRMFDLMPNDGKQIGTKQAPMIDWDRTAGEVQDVSDEDIRELQRR